MPRIRSSLIAALALVTSLTVLFPLVASAYTVPNLTAVASADRLIAITYADNPTRQAMLNAGAFTTLMQSYGFDGIPNYDPTSEPGSQIVCEMPQQPSGLWVVYGIRGDGVYEATGFCQFMSNTGVYVRWRLNS